jgi:hypothetical protein
LVFFHGFTAVVAPTTEGKKALKMKNHLFSFLLLVGLPQLLSLFSNEPLPSGSWIWPNAPLEK